MRVGDHLRLKVGLLFTEDGIRNKEDGSSKHQAGEEPIVGRAFELWLTTSVGSFGNQRVGFLSLFCDPEKFPSFFEPGFFGRFFSGGKGFVGSLHDEADIPFGAGLFIRSVTGETSGARSKSRVSDLRSPPIGKAREKRLGFFGGRKGKVVFFCPDGDQTCGMVYFFLVRELAFGGFSLFAGDDDIVLVANCSIKSRMGVLAVFEFFRKCDHGVIDLNDGINKFGDLVAE